MVKKGKKLRYVLFGLGILFMFFVGYSAYGIWSYQNTNQLVPSDATIVLGAAVRDDKPSPVLRERINHAIWLYGEGYVTTIIFTGGKAEGDAYAESKVSKQYAISRGVKPEHILTETTSKITEENLKYAYDIAKENNLKTFILVSDPLHMKRSMFMARNQGMTVYASPTPSSAYKTLKSKLLFLCRELLFYIGYRISQPFR